MVCRTIYRTAQFADGAQGKITSTQWLFSTYLCYYWKSNTDRIVTNYCAVVFDGAMITLAMVTLNIFHPGRLLENPQSEYSDYRLVVSNPVIPLIPP
jgi:hypothetical protein